MTHRNGRDNQKNGFFCCLVFGALKTSPVLVVFALRLSEVSFYSIAVFGAFGRFLSVFVGSVFRKGARFIEILPG